MDIKWNNMSGFGPTAWNHGGLSLKLSTMDHENEEQNELALHSHKNPMHPPLRLQLPALHLQHRTGNIPLSDPEQD